MTRNGWKYGMDKIYQLFSVSEKISRSKNRWEGPVIYSENKGTGQFLINKIPFYWTETDDIVTSILFVFPSI